MLNRCGPTVGDWEWRGPCRAQRRGQSPREVQGTGDSMQDAMTSTRALADYDGATGGLCAAGYRSSHAISYKYVSQASACCAASCTCASCGLLQGSHVPLLLQLCGCRTPPTQRICSLSCAPRVAPLRHPPCLHPSTLLPSMPVPPSTIHTHAAPCTSTWASRPALQQLFVPPRCQWLGLADASAALSCTHQYTGRSW